MDETALEGRFLIAMPGIGDPRFHRSVVLICAHSDQGAMGLIVNQRSDSIKFAQLLQQLDIEPAGEGLDKPIRVGGPVETTRGFVLHSADYESGSGLRVNERFTLTGTIDILRDIVGGEGPQSHLVALGYTGWSAGQLEREIQQNGWLFADASPEIVFGENDDSKWADALSAIGISPEMLSAEGGSA